MKRETVFILCGPTGSGKTDLSYRMAEKFPFEIVNCDVGQCYEPLTIGTAKPAWREHAVPHHLFDSLKEPRNMTVVEYRQQLQEIMQHIWQRKKIPLLVGGSLFYVRSLFFPPLEQEISVQSIDCANKSSQELWEMLNKLDPGRAQAITKTDRYRLERAVQLLQSGATPSTLAPLFRPLAPFYITYVTRDRAELYDRINQRTQQMFEQGWVQETVQLPTAWKDFLLQKKIMGYDLILKCIAANGEAACAQDKALKDFIAQKTRNYAKRQETFWRSLKEDLTTALHKEFGAQAATFGVLEEINLTHASIDVYLENIQSFMKKGAS